MSDWSAMLVAARTRLSVSQADLARRSHVSLPTIKAYEQGKRHPSRPYIGAILDALKVPVMERNALLEAAGYAPDGKDVVPSPFELDYTAEAAQAEIDRLTWPAFVLNEAVEVVFYNRIIEMVWGVDIEHENPKVADRSMLSVASDRRFADRILNWDDAVGTMAGVFKGHYRGAEDIETPSPAFGRIIENLMAGDAQYVSRFMQLWQDVPPAPVRLRWHYPMVWDVKGIGTIDFDCVVSHCSQAEAWAFNEWIPKDAASWAVLDQLKAESTTD